MAKRLSSPARRDQIIEAALELLAEVPVEALGTRAVAERVGVTQPALFRHFRSKDEMLEAVARYALGQLEAHVQAALAERVTPEETIRRVTHGLLEFASANPGVPALFFHDASRGEGARFHPPLRHMVSMQVALFGELARRTAQDEGLPPTTDPAAAAELFVATIQGLLLQWRHGRREIRPAEDAQRVVDFWLAGLRAGEPRGDGETAGAAASAESAAAPVSAAPRLAALDVRDRIAQGDDPLDVILAALRTVGERGALLLTAPFRPGPLLTLLEGDGWRTEAHEIGGGTWIVEVLGARAPGVRDLTDLEAPEPMEQVLLATAGIAAGDGLFFRLPRLPGPLLPHLEQRGLAFAVEETAGGQAILLVTHAEKAGRAEAPPAPTERTR